MELIGTGGGVPVFTITFDDADGDSLLDLDEVTNVNEIVDNFHILLKVADIVGASQLGGSCFTTDNVWCFASGTGVTEVMLPETLQYQISAVTAVLNPPRSRSSVVVSPESHCRGVVGGSSTLSGTPRRTSVRRFAFTVATVEARWGRSGASARQRCHANSAASRRNCEASLVVNLPDAVSR